MTDRQAAVIVALWVVAALVLGYTASWLACIVSMTSLAAGLVIGFLVGFRP